MPRDFVLGTETRSVCRVIRVGHALYVNLPKAVVELAALKLGDRLVIETDGRIVYAARIPFEELLGQRRRVVLKKQKAEAEANAALKLLR